MKDLTGLDVDVCPNCRDGTLEKSGLVESILNSG
jgi:hypothetical protein